MAGSDSGERLGNVTGVGLDVCVELVDSVGQLAAGLVQLLLTIERQFSSSTARNTFPCHRIA